MRNPFEHIPNSQLSALIDEWVKNKRNRKLLKERYIDGMGIEKLADKYRLSVPRVQTILRESASLLKSKSGNNIDSM